MCVKDNQILKMTSHNAAINYERDYDDDVENYAIM